jgi:hypothetical protein
MRARHIKPDFTQAWLLLAALLLEIGGQQQAAETYRPVVAT